MCRIPNVELKAKAGRRKSQVQLCDLKAIAAGSEILNEFLIQQIQNATAATTSAEILQNLDIWGLDVFKLAEVTENKPLATLVAAIFQKRGISDRFEIAPSTLETFLARLEGQYDENVPYHNNVHAADVTHCVHVLLNSPAFKGIFSDLEIFAAIFAAAIHDVGHPGLTNQYISKTRPDLGEDFKNRSFLEEHHLSLGFRLLKGANCDILSGLDSAELSYFKRLVTDMVLATDMAQHAEMMTGIKRLAQQKRTTGTFKLDTYAEKIQVLQFLLHCADLSNPTKRLDMYQRFVDALLTEFFRQGDKERKRGLTVSPLCDRDSTSVPKSQVGFINFVVLPLWQLWEDLVDDDNSKNIMSALKSNLEHYERQQ